MRIGLSFDLKSDIVATSVATDDFLEEYDSEETIQAITSALQKKGHTIIHLAGGREFLRRVITDTVDFVFNISEGRGKHRSREAQVPSVLEMLGIPYSGSDPLTLALCLDKPMTQKLVSAAGVVTPRHKVISSHSQTASLAEEWGIFPCLVKPACEGSSKGVHLGSRLDDMPSLLREATRMLDLYQQPVMVEEFIAGDEVTVGVIGQPPRVLGIMRVLPQKGPDPDFIYCLEVKRNFETLVSYECPANLPAETLHQIDVASLKVFQALGCRDVARLDFRVDGRGQPYFIEVNPLPGLRPGYSDLPIMAQMMGYNYDALVGLILECALERQFQCAPRSA
ncbi:MAG: D-alanine--D-alanine ligase [Chloroflexi bacterium]|nr:D-alanine--D-alanine ligase [Chloroflexota bacterium]